MSEETKKQKLISYFTRGCDLSDGRRFEIGDEVPADIKQKDLKALVEMDAVRVSGEADEEE
jgi:hypothetical protein